MPTELPGPQNAQMGRAYCLDKESVIFEICVLTLRKMVFTDVSGKSVCPIFNGQSVQEERFLLDCLTVEE
jgi:hypothetical protein